MVFVGDVAVEVHQRLGLQLALPGQRLPHISRRASMRHAMSSEKMRPYGGGVPIPKSSCADALSVGVHMNSAMYMTVSKQAWSCRV